MFTFPRPRIARAWLPCLLLLACAGSIPADKREVWRSEWNARADSATRLWENPCGDPEFGPWADEFLSSCQLPGSSARPDCRQRLAWVRERSAQCVTWKQYLLRNHNRQERTDDLPEPPTRVD